MLALREDPATAYRRAAFDARVRGAKRGELVHVCLDQVADGLARALRGDALGDNAARADGLTRALAALTALEMGIDRSAPLAGALTQMYGAARLAVLDAVTGFDSTRIGQVRADFVEIAAALRGA